MTTYTDYDSPWKEALELYFPEFLALCFPEAHSEIDWARGYEFMDKELQQVVRDAESGRRLADKLVKVWLKAGEETWLLVHIEVQGQAEAEFAQRMYTYHYRLFDRYAREVVSLAVLGDTSPTWRPTGFTYGRWGCRLAFEFPVLKLWDYRARWAELEASANPFATVLMAHLKAQETVGAVEQRKAWKWALVRRLYERGYARQDILNLFRFIDWLLALPAELEQTLWQDMQDYEEASRMTYVTSVERFGIEKGQRLGLIARGREAILDVVEARFASVPEPVAQRVNRIEDAAWLKRLLRQAALTPSLAEFTQWLEQAVSEQTAAGEDKPEAAVSAGGGNPG
jgi:hypothetical protein